MTEHNTKKLIRLYVPDADMVTGERFLLSDGQHHYLRNVMRFSAGDRLRVFNGRDGEYLAVIEEINKKNAVAAFLNKVRDQAPSPDVLVLVSPVKKENFDIIIEKSCELGAAGFVPVICDHTVVHRSNRDRLQAIANEAAEQSERLDVMAVQDMVPLTTALDAIDPARKIVFCAERRHVAPVAQALQAAGVSLPLAVLVGPEGGFSDAEMAAITARENVIPVSLGLRILRVETAVIAVLAAVMALCGDWR